jgi:urease accessory protein
MEKPGFLPLMVWLSPSFPVGAFAYSHGIEWVVEAGDIKDAATLESWLDDLLAHGGPWSDAVLLACAHRAAERGDQAALAEVTELAAAFAPSKERRLETLKQGEAFLQAVRAAWPCAALDLLSTSPQRGKGRGEEAGTAVAFPVAVGVTAAGHGIALAETLEAFLLALVTNLVSAAVRLVPLGQTEAAQTVARLTPNVRAIAARAAAATLDDLGGAALRSDIASMRHETQHTRLFRS